MSAMGVPVVQTRKRAQVGCRAKYDVSPFSTNRVRVPVTTPHETGDVTLAFAQKKWPI
jgi:hypothetical protein